MSETLLSSNFVSQPLECLKISLTIKYSADPIIKKGLTRRGKEECSGDVRMKETFRVFVRFSPCLKVKLVLGGLFCENLLCKSRRFPISMFHPRKGLHGFHLIIVARQIGTNNFRRYLLLFQPPCFSSTEPFSKLMKASMMEFALRWLSLRLPRDGKKWSYTHILLWGDEFHWTDNFHVDKGRELEARSLQNSWTFWFHRIGSYHSARFGCYFGLIYLLTSGCFQEFCLSW